MHVKINVGEIAFDKVYPDSTEEIFFGRFRKDVESMLPWLQRKVVQNMDDATFIAKLIEQYNKSTNSNEVAPRDIKGFVLLGKRLGFFTENVYEENFFSIF